MDLSKFRDERVHVNNSRVKGLKAGDIADSAVGVITTTLILYFYSASVRSLFVCLDQKYTICYKDPISELYNVYEGFNQDLKNQLVHVLNQADWLQMYSWFMQECPGMTTLYKRALKSF